MSLSQINDRLNQLGSSWEHFKKVNDERLKQVEQKGYADPLTNEHLSKVNDSIDSQRERLKRIEVALARPAVESKGFKFESVENVEHKSAFNSYVRKGIDDKLANLELKSLTTDATGSNGGYLVTANMQSLITGNIAANSIMRRICSVQEISSSSLDVIDDDNAFATAWSASEEAVVADSNNATLSKKAISAFELVAQPKVTQKLIDDGAIDIEAWLAERLAANFLEAEEQAFLTGTGSAQPTGILNYSAGTTSTTIERVVADNAVDGAFEYDDLMNLYYKLDEKYAKRGSFLMHRSAVQKVRMLKDANNNYIWQPAVLAGQDDMLLGAPVYQSSFMPVPGDSSLSIVFGDFANYQIVDRTGIRILRDPYTSKPYVRFYTTKRVGGDVVRTDAFKVLQCGTDGA